MCASVCECVQGVSWEAITRAKIWLVFQTASFGVAAGPKNTPPTDIHPVLYSWQSNPEKRVKLQHTFKQQLSRNSVNLNAFFTPPVGLSRGYLPCIPISVHVSQHLLLSIASSPCLDSVHHWPMCPWQTAFCHGLQTNVCTCVNFCIQEQIITTIAANLPFSQTRRYCCESS